MQRFVIASLALLLCAGCASSGAAKWRRTAANIPLGTPRAKVEALLPPASTALSLGANARAGAVSYWLDDKTIARMWYEDDCLARPIVVESLPPRRVVTKSDATRPGLHFRTGGDSSSSSK